MLVEVVFILGVECEHVNVGAGKCVVQGFVGGGAFVRALDFLDVLGRESAGSSLGRLSLGSYGQHHGHGRRE